MVTLEEKVRKSGVAGLSMAFVQGDNLQRTACYGYLEKNTHKKVEAATIFNSCSMSKFVTAMLTLVLVEKKFLQLDESVNNKLKNWKIPKNEFISRKEVTLRNLLSHQSGIKDPLHSFTEYSLEKGIPSMKDLLNGKTEYCSHKIEVTCEPGSQFHYCDAGYCIIQQLIEDTMGESFEKVMRQYVLDPLEMKNSHYLGLLPDENITSGHDKKGNVVDKNSTMYPYSAACGLWSTPSDLSLLVIELITAIKGKSKLGISSKNAKDLIHQQGIYHWAGLGVFLDGEEKEVGISSLGWGKGFQCMMVIFPYLEKGLVIMTNSDLGVHQMEGIIGEIYRDYKKTF